MITFQGRSKLNERKLKRKQSMSKDRAQMMLDSDVLKDSNFYIPMDTTNLMKSGILHTKLGSGNVIWNTPYARRLYYNPQYNFSKDMNPFAQGLWFEAAKSSNREDWLDHVGDEYAKYFDGR